MASVTEGEARLLFGGDVAALTQVVERFAFPRAQPFKLLETLSGRRFGPEMTAWIRIFERWELEAADPADAELKAPGEKQGITALVEGRGAAWLADFIAYFVDAAVVVQEDAMSYLASLAGTESGVCKVYYFHPNDWGLWPTDPSLTTRLYRTLQEEDRPELAHARFEGAEARRRAAALTLYETLAKAEALPALRDPARLWPRVDWLVHALLGVGNDFRRELDRAPPFTAYAEEAPHLAEHPHLGTYWLWAHFFLDNREALQDTLRRTAASEEPALAESRTLITALAAGERVRLGEHDQAALLALRDEIVQRAPIAAFEPAARVRANAFRADLAKESQVEEGARSVLEDAARREPLVREALTLLDHLAVGGAIPPEPAPVHGGLPVDDAVDRLAELMDPRFRPLVRARLERALHVGDSHQDAAWGLLVAWAAAAPDFDTFEGLLKEVGTENLGPRRLRELYRAYGRFDDPRATAFLVAGVRAWLKEMDDWIRMAPDEPLLQLFLRDTLDTHRVIAAVLERASYSAANWTVCVAAAVAAGELKSKRAVPGLRRAVESRLGRVDDGSRAKVVQALVAAEGASSQAFLRSLFDWSLDEWESADEDDKDGHEKDIACYLAGLLTLAPEDPVLLGTARRLLELFLLKLGPKRTPRRDMIAAAAAILAGVRGGEVRPLVDSVVPYRTLAFHETASTRAAAEELRTLADTVTRELEG
ncbi:MAG: hypothetical protein KC933_34825 [Myxococcales bacterium]|nr:hypothetical protein [Myxococcales bacterium]MCB9645231.1 hypothetical protein [Deltaproteobacteria bacterium]